MPTVIFPAIPVRDTNGEPLIVLRGQLGTIVQRGTDTPLTLVDVNGLPMSQPLYVTELGFLPTFGVVEGLTQADFVSGGIRMPIWSPTGLEASAAASEAGALAAQVAAEEAEASAAASANLVGAPADTVVSTMVKDERSLTGGAVLNQFRAFLGSAARDSEPLTKWAAALATGTAQAIVIGDSISQGGTATAMTLRWQTLVQAALRGAGVGATFPFLPANMKNSAWGIGWSGAGVSNSATGLSWYTLALTDATSKLTFLFTGDRCKIMYTKSPTQGVMTIKIDGGATVDVSQNGTTAIAQVWDSGALTSGAHTVEITRSATSSAGHNVFIEGCLTFNGDNTTGVRVLDASHSGYASSDMVVASRAANMAKALAAAGGASLAIIGFGTNDYSLNVVPSTFKANIEATIAALRVDGFNGSVLLLGTYMAQGRVPTTWQAYLDALAAIAAADADVEFLNLRDYMPDIPTPHDAPESRGFYADALHPSNAGHARIAEVLAPRLKGAGVLEMLTLRAT